MANFSAEILEELDTIKAQLENLMDQYAETSEEHLEILSVWVKIYNLFQNNGDKS